jgi:hypothetical protein
MVDPDAFDDESAPSRSSQRIAGALGIVATICFAWAGAYGSAFQSALFSCGSFVGGFGPAMLSRFIGRVPIVIAVFGLLYVAFALMLANELLW